MKPTHEEVVNIIVQQIAAAANEIQKGISVLSDNTDVFVLPLHDCLAQKLPVITESPKNVPKFASRSPTTEAIKEKIN